MSLKEKYPKADLDQIMDVRTTKCIVRDKNGNPSCYMDRIDAERLGFLKAGNQNF